MLKNQDFAQSMIKSLEQSADSSVSDLSES